MKLGDFSSKFKGMSIQPGSVFRMTLFPKDGVTPKNEGDKSRTKYFVVIGIDDESLLVGSLLINSDVNINLVHAIAPYQHCIYPKDYAFLGDKYRFIDCYRIKELSFAQIIEDGDYIGTVSAVDLDKAIDLANASPVNKPLTLKKFGIFKEKEDNQQ